MENLKKKMYNLSSQIGQVKEDKRNVFLGAFIISMIGIILGTIGEAELFNSFIIFILTLGLELFAIMYITNKYQTHEFEVRDNKETLKNGIISLLWVFLAVFLWVVAFLLIALVLGLFIGVSSLILGAFGAIVSSIITIGIILIIGMSVTRAKSRSVYSNLFLKQLNMDNKELIQLELKSYFGNNAFESFWKSTVYSLKYEKMFLVKYYTSFIGILLIGILGLGILGLLLPDLIILILIVIGISFLGTIYQLILINMVRNEFEVVLEEAINKHYENSSIE